MMGADRNLRHLNLMDNCAINEIYDMNDIFGVVPNNYICTY